MTTYTWNTGTSADWNTAADWGGGVIPDSATADVVIDAGPVTVPYTVDISTGESILVNSIELNIVNNAQNLNSTYDGAILEVDGTLTFAPGSTGAIGGPLQNEMVVNGGTVQNAGTISAFVLSEGTSTFTGTNGIYFSNWLESLGTVTIDTAKIAEYTPATKTLFDGIFEARGTGNVINLGGAGGGLIVNIATVQGPGTDLPGSTIPGWTELIFDGPGSEINEWNGTAYVSVESSITTLQNYATIDVNVDPVSSTPSNYTTANKLSIGANSVFFQQGGTLTTGGITILNGGTLGGAPTTASNIVNDGTILVSNGEMVLGGSVTGTGVLTFDSTVGTLAVQGVAAGETVALQGNDALIIGAPAAFDATLTDHGGNDLVLVGVVANSATLAGGKLSIYEGTTLVDAITMAGSAPPITVQSIGANSIITFGVIAPEVTAGASATYAAGAAPTLLDSTLTVSDPNTSTLVEATVAISAGFIAGDTLNQVTQEAGIASSYDPSTGVLTLSGAASVATYQDALDSVTYNGVGDPTAGGTDLSRTITWSISDGSTTASANSSLTTSFASNPNADIQLQNVDGQMTLWQMTGSTLSAFGTVGPDPGSFWTAVATGPFFSGDTSGIAFQGNDGSVAMWQVSGTTLIGGGVVNANPGTAWHVRGTGDFYNDGGQDLLWQADNGQVALWDMNGASIFQAGDVADPGPTWLVKGTGDFFNDGHDDILLQNQDGSVALWDMNGTTISQGGTIDFNPGPSWSVVATGDFYGDGNTDIVWQASNGQIDLWDMSGLNVVQSGDLADPGPTWHVVGTGDFNNDGRTDLVLQNENGSVVDWEMSGTTIIGGGVIANPGASSNVLGADTMRFIDSGAGGETIAATTATPDDFIFTNAAAGLHTITGFNSVQDIVELPGAQFASFAAVQAATQATAGGALIDMGNGGTLLLSGVSTSSLHASNFSLT